MSLDEMNLQNVEERLAALDEEVRSFSKAEDVEKATEEKKGLLTRKAELKDLEQRKQTALELNEGKAPEKKIETRKEEPQMDELEKRGKDLKENRSVTVASTGVLLHEAQAANVNPTFNEVSSLIDRVRSLNLPGGESFEQPYLASYGTGDYKTEGIAYAAAEPVFASATIAKAKVTAYAEFTEELEKLPAADYANIVMQGVPLAVRKKIAKEILVGDGETNHLVGIFDNGATAIDAATDLPISEINEDTLDEIIFSFGGDEDTEDAAVLILNKDDLKEFAMLRDSNGRKIYDIKPGGNVGTIDGVPYILNSACKAISASATVQGDFAMAYGPLSNYLLTVFSPMEVKRSDDFKFNVGMIAHRASVFVGGNVVAANGFLRVKKA
jgi:HK97 family phage major capsid protein